MKKNILNRNIKFCFLIVYAFFLLCVLVRHEPSVDEVQAWNIARDLSIFDIFKQMKMEGHPCLWHLILFPFAKLNLPIYFISVISCLIMIFTAYLIIFKSPFSFFLKLIIIISSPFIYYYSIISRSYCLIALLVVLLCINYKNRILHPYRYGTLLFCLFNTHVIVGGMASILLFLFILESLKLMIKDKKINNNLIIGSFIGFIGGIVLCLQVVGSYDTNSLTTHLDYNSFTFIELVAYFFEKYNLDFYYITNGVFNLNISYFIFFTLLILVFILSIYSPKAVSIFLVSYVYFLFVNYFLFYSTTLRAVLIILFLMVLCWIIQEDHKNKKLFSVFNCLLQIFLVFYCVISIPFGIASYLNDFNNDVTDAPYLADYIENNIKADSTIIAIGLSDVTVLGYLPERKLYDINNKRYMTFMNWDRTYYDEITYDKVVNSFDEIKNKKYILFATNINESLDSIINRLETEEYISIMYESEFENQYFNTSQSYVKYKLYEVFK